MDIGIVFSIMDGVARVVAIEHTFIGELVVIAALKAMALNLEESLTALTILGNDRNVLQGDLAERTWAELLIEVGFYLVGRIIDPAANFLDE